MGKIIGIRTLLRILVYGLFALGVLLVTSFWWLPLALPAVLRQWDVQLDSVELLPSGRWRLDGLEYLSDAVRLRVGEVEAPSPHLYLWERFGSGFSDASLVDIDSIRVEPQPEKDDPNVESPVGSFDPVVMERQLRDALDDYGKWLPPLEVGVLFVASGEDGRELPLSDLSLRERELVFKLEDARLPERLLVSLSLDSGSPWSARLTGEDSGLRAALELKPRTGQFDLSFMLQQGEASLEGNALFVRGQSVPVRANLVSESFRIDRRWMPLPENWPLEELRFSDIDLWWKEGAYSGTLSITGSYLAEGKAQVPLQVDLGLSGDLETSRINTCELMADWGQLELMQPLEVRWKDGSVLGNASLRVKIDLAKQPFVKASGQLEGRLSAVPSLSGGPNVEFELSAGDVSYEGCNVDQIELSGRFKGGRLSIEKMALKPVRGAESETIELSGVTDLATQELNFEYKILFGAGWANAQQSKVVFSETLDVSGRIDGTYRRPVIEGRVASLNFRYPGMAPVALAGTFRTEGTDRFSLEAEAGAGDSKIDASLDGKVVEGSISVALNKLVWTDPSLASLELQAPTQLTYRYSGPADAPEARLSIAPFHLAGPELSVSGVWDPESGLELNLSHVTFQRIGLLVERELPAGSIESLSLSLSQLRPRILGSVGLHLKGRLPGDEVPVQLDLAARLNDSGVSVDRMNVMFADQALLQGSVVLPLGLRIPQGEGSLWSLARDGSIGGELSGASNKAFSDWLARRTNIRLDQATLDLRMEGSMRKPTGLLDLRLAALSLPFGGFPPLERVSVSAKATPETLFFERFECLLSESRVSGTLELPVDVLVDSMQGDEASRAKLLARSRGTLELIDWRAEDWADFLPAMIRRSGGLSASLALQPGLNLEGNLSFRDFALRPTSSLPSVDSIRGEIALSDRKLEVKSASARIGGNPALLSGWLDASDQANLLWEFTVTGDNVPLARTTDMILRSDLDLKASRTSRTEPPLVSGALNLRSSTMMVNFDPLSPRVEGGPQAKPPYFSITDPALADWRLDVAVTGDSFMRVRSPYFKTQLSANFDLSGTFEQPLLIGSARTVNAEFRFPGAKMRVSRGEAFIERERPNEVQLDFTGIARRASYVITMDVSETLDAPQIQFQSTPPLSNASIVRLLATGSPSGGGVGAVGIYLGQGLLGPGDTEGSLSDRVSVDIGEETTSTGRNTVGVQYDLSKDLYLKGEYDKYNAYNLDLVWSIFKQ